MLVEEHRHSPMDDIDRKEVSHPYPKQVQELKFHPDDNPNKESRYIPKHDDITCATKLAFHFLSNDNPGIIDSFVFSHFSSCHILIEDVSTDSQSWITLTFCHPTDLAVSWSKLNLQSI